MYNIVQMFFFFLFLWSEWVCVSVFFCVLLFLLCSLMPASLGVALLYRALRSAPKPEGLL